jgi:hypothetical protein
MSNADKNQETCSLLAEALRECLPYFTASALRVFLRLGCRRDWLGLCCGLGD